MMTWETYIGYVEDEYDDGLPCEPDDHDYEMMESEANPDFWTEQEVDEYLLEQAAEKQAIIAAYENMMEDEAR